MLSKYKSEFYKKTKPFAILLKKAGLTPNALTTLGLLFALVTSYFILIGNHTVAGFYLVLALLFDALDGSLARLTGKTKFGDFYDAFIDRVVEIILFVSIAFVFPELLSRAIFALLLSLMVSYIAARSEVWTIGVHIRYKGIGSRAERMLIFFLGFITGQMKFAFEIIILIAFIGLLQRFYTAFRELR